MFRTAFVFLALSLTLPAWATTVAIVDFERAVNETTEGKAAQVRPTRALFHYPLAAALALAALLVLCRLANEAGLSVRPTRFAATDEEMAR